MASLFRQTERTPSVPRATWAARTFWGKDSMVHGTAPTLGRSASSRGVRLQPDEVLRGWGESQPDESYPVYNARPEALFESRAVRSAEPEPRAIFRTTSN